MAPGRRADSLGCWPVSPGLSCSSRSEGVCRAHLTRGRSAVFLGVVAASLPGPVGAGEEAVPSGDPSSGASAIRCRAAPCLRGRPPVEVLVGVEVVVPGADPVEVGVGDNGPPGPRLSLPDHFFDRLKEPFDSSVLPGREGVGPLMPHAEEPEDDAEEPGAHGRLVVGTEDLGRAVALEEVEELAEYSHHPPAFDRPELKAYPGAVVRDAEDGGRITIRSGDPGPVECLDHVARERAGPSMLELPAEPKDLLAVRGNRVCDDGFADGHSSAGLVETVEGGGDPLAAGFRHQGLEPVDLAPYSGRFRQVDPARWRRGRFAAPSGA